MTFLSRRSSGTLPAAISWARPSTIAVLPTPASPMQHGIVLGAAAENLDDALDFVLAADDRVDLAFLGQLREVAAEGAQARAS